ncbi:MAG: T9SS type A sorting domain-containing protein, partial [Ignavibacteriaceae bacterium]|nr:T9SS type A sorting domain-containing protein [Ignavibacteriaceae bacterium]
GYSTDGGGIWDGTTYVSATLSVAVPAPSAPTLVSPLNNSTGISTLPTLTWNASTNATSYRLIIATNSDFTDVVYNDSTITDTSKTLSAALQNNKQYYWKVNAKNGSGTSSYSTTWNFTTVAVIGWANLQWPPNANISSDSSVTVYTRIWVNGITDQPGAGPGILGWIGYSTTNSNPANWTNWIPAVYNVDAGNDDEYMAAIGNNLPAGTYYYASRFNLNSGEYKYGGYNEAGGGFWDSTNNVSGVLVVNSPLPTAPEQLLPLNNSYNQTLTLQFKWSSVPSAINYRLQVATDQGFANVIYNDSTLTDTTVTLSNVLLNSTIYYWRVRAKNISGNGPFSAIWNFKTISEIPIVSNLWQLNSGNGTLPGWFSTNNTERGIAFGSTNSKLESDDRLFITSTNGGIFIRILNASNGAEVGSLNNTGITGGALPISDVETTADGKILVCNLTENASLSPFKIYLWNSETSVPSNIINWLSSDAVKLGDKFTVTGSYSDNSAVIYAASETNGINKLYKWTMSGGAFTNNPTIINLTGVEEVPAPSASVGPLPNGDFYWKASMMKLRKYTSTGSLIDTIPSAVVPLQGNAVRYVGKVNNKEYAVIFQYGNINENARIIEVSDNNYSQAISLETTPTLGMNPNIYGFGDVTVRINQNGSADIYVLSTNNGIGRYQTIQPIPVELSSFNAIANGDNVTLHWSTATESNSREFIIERMDGKDTEWKIIGKVDAKGSSVSQTDYSYKDEHLMEGIHEYRLKMVDVDGTFSYSQVINVETGNPTSYLLMQNYPNPFNPSTSISYQLSENSKVRLTIYDITGREIAILIDKQQDAGYYRIDFNASNLTSGIYFYELIAGDFRDVKKLVLMK